MLCFYQSLFFKFSNSPETVYIFQDKLNNWSLDVFGIGLLTKQVFFSQHVIGSAELVASILLLFSLKGALWARGLGALLGVGIMSGAIFFHLFTPLGVAVQNTDGTSDGGELFAMACLVWLSCAYLAYKNKDSC